jgi:hypothetical protein
MTTKPRPLGNNAANAVDDIDEILEANRRVLVDSLTHIFRGDVNAAGAGIALAIDNNSLAARIAVLTRAGEFDCAARVLPESRNRRTQT